MNRNSVWVQQDGTRTPIRLMETSHIKNCLSMINLGWRQEYKKILEKELELRKTKLYQALK